MLQREVPLITFVDAESKGRILTADALDLWRGTPPVRFPILRFDNCGDDRRFDIYGSCDGLIVLKHSDRRFYICNPATLQWLRLSELNWLNSDRKSASIKSAGIFAALYPHPSSKEYHILCYCDKPSMLSKYYVLKVGSSEKPKCIGQPADSTQAEQVIEVIKYGLPDATSNPPVLLRNCLYWKKKGQLIVFDTGAESFRLMPSPTDNKDAHLFRDDDVLYIGYVGEGTAKVWEMKDNKMDQWNLKFDITLPINEMGSFIHGELVGKVVSKNGDVLVGSSYCSKHMFHCDNTGKMVKQIQWNGYPRMISGHRFKDSIVRHAFFSVNGTKLEGLPGFFQGFTSAMSQYSKTRKRFRD